MKKILSIVLAAMLLLSCGTALAVTVEGTQNVYNFTETTGDTLVYTNVEGFYLWSVPAETLLDFTPSKPDKAYVFGDACIWNVLFNKYANVNYFNDEKNNKLDSDMLITVTVDDRTDLILNETLYSKTNEEDASKTDYITVPEYKALKKADQAEWTEIKYTELPAVDQAKLVSIIEKEEWDLYTEQLTAVKTADAENVEQYTLLKSGEKDTAFVDADGDAYLLKPGTAKPIVAVRTGKEVTKAEKAGDPDTVTAKVWQVETVETEDGTGDPAKFIVNEAPDAKDAATFNLLQYTELTTLETKATTQMYYTCFGTPSLLGRHEGKVTYKAEVRPVEITTLPKEVKD